MIHYVFGLGTGRCGTFSLARLLDIQQDAYVTHEHGPCLPWVLNEARVERKINDIKSRIQKGHIIVGDVALFNLRSAEMLLRAFPTARFIILKRDKVSTINSWEVKWLNKYNRFARKETKWDECFPSYNLPLREALSKYYDEYYTETVRLEELYPNSFKHFSIDCLNSKEGLNSIFDFCGVLERNLIYKIGIKDNMSKEIENNKFDKYERLGAYHLDWFRTNKHGYRDHLNRILREFTGCKAKTIFDLGCGEGLLAKLLLKKGVTQKVIGIDSNSTAIKLGRELYSNSCKTKQMELIGQPFSAMNKRRKFDYVICSEVIEHVDQPKAFIGKMCKMARKWTIITTPNANFITPGKYDKQLFTPCELEDMLISMGFKTEFLEIEATLVVKVFNK